MRTKRTIIVICIFVISITSGLIAQSIFGDDLDENNDYYNNEGQEQGQDYQGDEGNEFEESDNSDDSKDTKSLRDLFIDIEENSNVEELEHESSNAGYYVNEYNIGDMYKVEISEDPSPEIGEGAEEWYKYDFDHIQITYFENEEGEKESLSKDYYLEKNHMLIEYSFGDKMITATNHFPGYSNDGTYEEKTDFKTIEEAFEYAENYKR